MLSPCLYSLPRVGWYRKGPSRAGARLSRALEAFVIPILHLFHMYTGPARRNVAGLPSRQADAGARGSPFGALQLLRWVACDFSPAARRSPARVFSRHRGSPGLHAGLPGFATAFVHAEWAGTKVVAAQSKLSLPPFTTSMQICTCWSWKMMGQAEEGLSQSRWASPGGRTTVMVQNRTASRK